MKSFLIPIWFIWSIQCFSQPATLKILGVHDYTVSAESYGAIISLEENPNKCDPAVGFVSLEEQYAHLTESMIARGIMSPLIPISNHAYSPYRKQSYRFEESDAELFDQVMMICQNLLANVERTYFKLPKHDLISEDANAIAAFKDAKIKADVLAGRIDHEVVKVLYIDDDTMASSWLSDLEDYDPDKAKLILQRMEEFNSTFVLSRLESNRPFRYGRYTLWVTFVIKPN